MAIDGALQWLHRLDGPVRADAIAGLRRLLHDVNNPLSAASMDLFVVQHGLGSDAQTEAVSSALGGIRRSLAELEGVLRDVERSLEAVGGT